MAVFRLLGDQTGIAWMLLELGQTALQAGELPSAHAFYVQSLAESRALKHE